MEGLAGNKVAITEYWAAAGDSVNAAYPTKTMNVLNGQGSYFIDMPANTCVGLIIVPTVAVGEKER